jgi:zinc protease
MPPKAQRLVVNEPVDVGKVAFGWIAPPTYSDAHAALTVLATLLADGKSTRLYRSLVVDKRLAVDVDAEADGNALESMFLVDAMATKGTSLQELEQALEEQLLKLQTVPPTEVELERAKKRLNLELVSELELLNGPGGESGRAGLLQRFNHYLGDPGAVACWHARLQAVTSADIVTVAKTYLLPSTRITVVTEPKKAENTKP